MLKGSEVFAPLAEDYARYRPGYPAEVLDALETTCGLTPDWVVADIGSGTGNLARLFLDAGHQVIGVEPNRAMRTAGERLLATYPSFRSHDGTAECIPLPAQSVDIVTVGQALHWFDVDQTKREFQRILRDDGWVAVAWNDRLSDASEFTREYHALTRTCAETHPSPCTAPLSAGLGHLFAPATPLHASFPHTQRFDLEGLLGRARSSGYLPPSGAPGHTELTARMTDLFHRHQHLGTVIFHYTTQLYIGKLQA